jgi:hypothetical protein
VDQIFFFFFIFSKRKKPKNKIKFGVPRGGSATPFAPWGWLKPLPEALTDEIEEESQIVEEVLRIEEILYNSEEEVYMRPSVIQLKWFVYLF